MKGAARLLAALALLVALCAGRRVDSSIETQYAFPVLTDKFGTQPSIISISGEMALTSAGFEEDSFLSISLDYTPPSVPLRFLMCSEADVRYITSHPLPTSPHRAASSRAYNTPPSRGCA